MIGRDDRNGVFVGQSPNEAPTGPRHILLVAYFYPPSRDTGARRPAAMAKYLRRLGHRVTVLTTTAYGRLEGPEESEIVRSADAQRLRARLHGRERIDALFDSDTYSGEPHFLSRMLVPEPLVVAWLPFARSAALRHHRRDPFDAVITTSPPESAHAVGRALARRGVPWVADVRDAWSFEPLRPGFPIAAQRWLDERLERRWLGSADVVVCVSRPAAEDLRARLGIEPLLVPNGWDPDEQAVADDDEAAAKALLEPGRRSLVYTGRFGGYGRDPGPLVRALESLAREEPEIAGAIELVVAGPLTGDERSLLEAAAVAPARIVLTGSLSAARARALQREADALLLIASSLRSQLANYKLFEYLAADRPIVALAAGTEAGRIVAEAGGEVIGADDEGAIAAALRRFAVDEVERTGPEARAQYSYPGIAEQMVSAVRLAVGRPGKQP
jgi:glycosyltransferase involved in cell wall biosynthesis